MSDTKGTISSQNNSKNDTAAGLMSSFFLVSLFVWTPRLRAWLRYLILIMEQLYSLSDQSPVHQQGVDKIYDATNFFWEIFTKLSPFFSFKQ